MPKKKNLKTCMGCGKTFPAEQLQEVDNVPFCPECHESGVAEEFKVAKDAVPTEDFSEHESVPKYAVVGDDPEWEQGFASHKMVKISRERLAGLERPLPLEEHQAGAFPRLVAWVADIALILLLGIVPFYLYTGGGLRWLLPGDDVTAYSILLVHAVLAFFYYRWPFTAFGGSSLGRIIAGIKLVDKKGALLNSGKAFVYCLLQAIADITLVLSMLNGLVFLFSKQKRSVIDHILDTQVVESGAWTGIAQQRIYQEDAEKLP